MSLQVFQFRILENKDPHTAWKEIAIPACLLLRLSTESITAILGVSPRSPDEP